MPKQKIMSAITLPAKYLLIQNFKTPGTGSSYLLEMFSTLYPQEVAIIKTIFSPEELTEIIYSFKSRPLHPDMAGRIIHNTQKISACSVFTRACLEIWAKAFWLNNNAEDLENYIK